jgi:hypothetical protein
VAIQQTPNVVGGTVIRTSHGTLLLLCACSGLLAFAAGFVLWDSWGHGDGEHVLPFQLPKDSLHTSYPFVLGVLGGVGCLIGFAYKCLFPHQLILGEEVLQVTQRGVFGPTVETQVPYANIAAVTCEPVGDGSQRLGVGIDLRCLGAPGTYSCRRDFGERDKNGRDLYLPSLFTAGPEEIARLIEERCRKRNAATSGG